MSVFFVSKMVEEMEVTVETGTDELPISNIPNLALAKLRVLQDPKYDAALADHYKAVGEEKKEEILK